MQLVTLEDIHAAADRVRDAVVRTPLIPARWADAERPLWIKPENLQPIGAFKIRGAFNAIGNLTDADRARGVVAYSSGNHAQAVAYAAAAFGTDAHIVMPRETPQVKVAATRDYGAKVVLCGPGEQEPLLRNGRADVANQSTRRLLAVMPQARTAVCEGDHGSTPFEPTFQHAVSDFFAAPWPGRQPRSAPPSGRR